MVGNNAVVSVVPEPETSHKLTARPNWIDRLAALQHSSALAYITILLLQLHRIWNIWTYRDLTTGDTGSYFRDAWTWHHIHKVNIVWSPLYTMFYGSMLGISRDAYVATTLHRVLIILAATTLVLAIMRRLLPASLAWLATAWWAILPINFNTLYEVHLFALLPIALAWLVALRVRKNEVQGVWQRAIVLAIFVLTTFLVRNEYVISCGIFALVCIVVELRIAARLEPDRRFRWIGGATAVYLGLLLASGGIIVGFFCRSTVRFHTSPTIKQAMDVKHTLNMAQVYAFGYQQRHPEWTKSPWTDCGELCQKTFHVPMPTLWQMARNNPRALRHHILWNVSLVPNGWQILLLNTSSGTVDPDYAPQAMGLIWPKFVSLAMIAVVLAGAIVWWFERPIWREWFSQRGLGWLAMLAAISVGPAVVITQRPRPSYFFTVGVFSMAVVGMAVWILIRRLHTRRYEWTLMLPIMLLGWHYVPTYYDPAPRPVHDDYERLAPYSRLISKKNVRFLAGFSPSEIASYVAHAKGTEFDYSIMFPEYKGQVTLVKFLAEKRLNLAYFNDWSIGMLRYYAPGALEKFMAEGGKDGWVLLASGREPEPSNHGPEHWLFFARTVQSTSGPTWQPNDPISPAELIPMPPDPPTWKTAGHGRKPVTRKKGGA